MITEIIVAVIVSSIGYFLVYFITPFLIKFLHKKNLVVKDFNKKGHVMVARPGGPSIIAGILAAELVLFIFYPTNSILAIVFTSVAAFIVGFIDDRKVMGGWFKPITLAFAALPILLLGVYDTNLAFPIFGEVRIPVLYIAIVIFMIPITGNTINSIDVLNGVASGFMAIASFSLTISLFIVQYFSSEPNFEIVIASLPLGFVSLAFYKYHKHPSKIFPGDSGALTLGAMYGTIAILGDLEIIAAIALLPAVINSFLFLSSMKKIVEHRKINAKPVGHTDDMKLCATNEKEAPVTLVRLILSKGPLTEKQIGFEIFKLALFSGFLAIISTLLMVFFS